MTDRLSIRSRPPGRPLLYQSWGKLLFLHWPVPESLLRPLVPRRLQIDTYEGRAWIGVTPFTMWGVRPRFLPAVPRVSTTHELNVRTYVHLDGVPGVWFFSLDASNPLAVFAARLAFYLPYFRARMDLKQEHGEIHFISGRRHRGARAAAFEARWSVEQALPPAEPGSLAFFLTERYCLYAEYASQLFRARIFHPPWPLRQAALQALSSTMIQAQGLPEPEGAPLLHYAEALHVGVWPLRRVAS